MKKYLITIGVITIALMVSTAGVNCAEKNIQTTTIASMQNIQQTFLLPSFSLAIAIDGKLIFADAVGYADIHTYLSHYPKLAHNSR